MKKPFWIMVGAIAAACAMPAAAQDIDRADTNHDGKISRAEFIAARSANFDKLDRNGDGVISQADIGMIARFRPAIGEKFNQMIAADDTDHDGQVTPKELAIAPAPAFDRADANHDGVIDASEMAALRANLAAMRGER